MGHLTARVGQREVRIRFEARTGRVQRLDWQALWPLDGLSEELESVLKGLLRCEPPGADIALDIARIDRAILARRQRFPEASRSRSGSDGILRTPEAARQGKP